MKEEYQTLREIVRSVENRLIEVHTDVKNIKEIHKERIEDQEKRLRKVEKGFWGVVGTNIVGWGSGIWAWISGH